MLKRLFVYAIVLAVAYYGYGWYVRFAQETSDLRQQAGAQNNADNRSDPLGAAARRRQAEEQSVTPEPKKADP